MEGKIPTEEGRGATSDPRQGGWFFEYPCFLINPTPYVLYSAPQKEHGANAPESDPDPLGCDMIYNA